MKALRTVWICGGMRRGEDKILPHTQCGVKLMKLLSLHLRDLDWDLGQPRTDTHILYYF